MIEIRLIEQLVALAEYGTLSKASEMLHTSQPTLTRSMKQLEDELQVKLFIRSKNHIVLNETGIKAAEYARHVLVADKDFEAKVKAFDRSLRTVSIGYCAPVPQMILTPIINNLYGDMTISSDMMDDRDFEEKLLGGTYQLAVTHYKPGSDELYYRKCGSEQLYISLPSGSPLAFYPEVHLSDLDGLSILLLSRIGFWANIHRAKTPNTKYLLQIEEDSFSELASTSDYPIFSSSYFVDRGETLPGRVNIPISDPECRVEYYITCSNAEKKRFEKLFKRIKETTIK